jgi:hypothetical protein
MTAKIDFELGREPAKFEPVVDSSSKCRLGKIHFGGDGLHPLGVSFPVEQANGGGIARKRFVREGVDLEEGDGHEGVSRSVNSAVAGHGIFASGLNGLKCGTCSTV